MSAKIEKWLREAFKSDFQEIHTEITGKTLQGDGFVGDVVFATVKLSNPPHQEERHAVVVKYGKEDPVLRERIPVKQAYERETFMYTKAFPLFKRFEEDHHVTITPPLLPECLTALVYDQEDVVVLRDMRSLDFEMRDKLINMDFEHLKLTFESYGKFHGVSVAYRDQEPEKFKEVFGGLECVQTALLERVKEPFNAMEKGWYDLLEDSKEFDALKKLKEKIPEGVRRSFLNIFQKQDGEERVVLTHGDCWNNNYLFKYENTKPSQMVFLDFQLSRLASPVLDLSAHLYVNGSSTEFAQLKQLLRHYYDSFSTTIKRLGSDPETLFSYSDLVRHWKEYSIYGLLLANIQLPIILADRKDALDLKDITDEHNTGLMEQQNMRVRERVKPRIIAGVKHFIEFDDFF